MSFFISSHLLVCRKSVVKFLFVFVFLFPYLLCLLIIFVCCSKCGALWLWQRLRALCEVKTLSTGIYLLKFCLFFFSLPLFHTCSLAKNCTASIHVFVYHSLSLSFTQHTHTRTHIL